MDLANKLETSIDNLLISTLMLAKITTECMEVFPLWGDDYKRCKNILYFLDAVTLAIESDFQSMRAH